VSTEEQRTAVLSLVEETDDWMYDEGPCPPSLPPSFPPSCSLPPSSLVIKSSVHLDEAVLIHRPPFPPSLPLPLRP